MAGKVVSGGFRGILLKRSYAAQAATAKKSDQPETTCISLPKQDAKTTTLPNGLIVASIEDYSPISRVGVMVKAGSRYEPINQLGISHCLRNCSGLSTKKSTIFGITRNIEKVGGNLQTSTSRENIFYELSCKRDSFDSVVRFLGETVTRPEFFHWEVSDYSARMRFDREHYKADPVAVLVEAIHKASFRGGLRNSLYSPKFMIGHHSPAMLNEFVDQTFGTNRIAIVGLGMEHDRLLEHVNTKKFFFFKTDAGAAAKGDSKFKGGELFLDAKYPLTLVSVVAEGAGFNNQKDVLCLALLHRILGEGPLIKYSSSITSKLGAAAAKAASGPFAVSGVNINYSDTGLFGFMLAGQPEDMDKMVKDLVAEMRNLKKVSAKEVNNAKNRLKASLNINLECRGQQLENMALSALTIGQLVTASDIEKAIDAISLQDVTTVASRVLKGKPAMAAYGQLHKTPYLEDLI